MIQFKVQYNPKNRLRKDGTAQVFIFAYQSQISKEGKILRKKGRLLIPTEIFLKPIQWITKHSKVAHHPNALLLNQKITTQLSAIQRFCIDREVSKGIATIEDLKEFAQYGNVESFLEFYKREMDKDKTIQEATRKNLRKAYNHLSRYKQQISFNELTYDLITGFDNEKYKDGLHVNTIADLHVRIKRMINLAIKKGLFDMNKNPYLNFKIKKQPTTRTVLEKHELESIEQCTFDKKHKTLHLIRDTFLFQCYTGLRYKDLYNVKASDIKKGTDGLELHITAQKTQKPLKHQLSKMFSGKPAKIVERYLVGKKATDRLLHVPSNQKYNARLKDLAKWAGIEKCLTSHVARHTFATLLLTAGVPIIYVQKLLQHSKISTTQIYEHINKNEIYDKLGEMNWG
ncbi:MAG: site-specific integrase [Aureispira sp.]|nr:site-specific integrase [Aureispira sp.]